MSRTVISNFSPSGENRIFVLRFLNNGQPCLIGNSKKHMEENDESFIVVFDPDGNRRNYHSLPELGKCLYEIHTSDFIGIFEYDNINDILLVNTYKVMRITDKLAYCVHCIL